jgi:outer membrane receptor protein involved in Fe transport
MLMNRRALLLFAVVVVPAALPAEELPEEPPARLPEVVVTGARLPDEGVALETFPANVTVLTESDIAASPAFTLPELLRQQVGLVPLDTVGFGQFANVSLRGYGERTGLLVLVDGVRVNDAGDSTFPFLWNTIPLESIERVEIIRGGASTTYGEGALGGVINIITKKGADRPLALSVTGTGGNLGYYDAHAEAGGSLESFQYQLSGERQEWAGWRDASGFRSWTAIARPTVNTPLGRLTLGYYFHDETVENPGVLTPEQFRANPRQKGDTSFVFDNTIHRGTLDYSTQFGSGWKLLANVFGQSFDTESFSAFGRGRIEQPNFGATMQASYRSQLFGRENLLTLGAEIVRQDFRSLFDSVFGTFTTGADNWTASGFVQNTLNLTPKLALTGGVRFDHREWDVVVLDPFNPSIRQDKHADVWSPKVSVSYEIAEKVFGWATVSRSFRLPTGFDIGAAGSAPGELFFANPNVDPVDARSVEIGVRCRRSALLGGSITYFYSDVNDDILFNPFSFQNENFDSVRQGVELALNSRPADWIDFYFTAAFTDARFDGGAFDANRLPLVAQWQLTGGANWRPRALRGWQFTLESVHLRGQLPANDLRNDFAANQYTLLNAKARYQWRDVTFFAAVNNILDRLFQSFPSVATDFLGNQEQRFNAAPGISFQVGATARF